MRTERNQTKMVFKDQYNQLTLSQKIELRDEFIASSGISLPTFYQKLNSDNWKPLERTLFDSILTKVGK
ncbi:hypothetical protein [Phocaeicola paurosaccharolyticus]|uniref:hypothetical protein n=1 Tax=Phocaeicola paurosaccharolyticus TaxID=732242 RepID=UPI002FE2DB8E